MDKLAYHCNKKKLPAKTEGKYLYYYPCADTEQADVQMGGRGYIVVEVTGQEWEALIELDRIDYNNEHKYVRHTTPMPDGDEVKAFLNYYARKKYVNDEEKNDFFGSFINRVILFDDRLIILYNTGKDEQVKIDNTEIIAGINGENDKVESLSEIAQQMQNSNKKTSRLNQSSNDLHLAER